MGHRRLRLQRLRLSHGQSVSAFWGRGGAWLQLFRRGCCCCYATVGNAMAVTETECNASYSENLRHRRANQPPPAGATEGQKGNKRPAAASQHESPAFRRVIFSTPCLPGGRSMADSSLRPLSGERATVVSGGTGSHHTARRLDSSTFRPNARPVLPADAPLVSS